MYSPARGISKFAYRHTLTLGKIIFGYTPRVVFPPQQPVSNATMEQVQGWGEDISNDGLDAI